MSLDAVLSQIDGNELSNLVVDRIRLLLGNPDRFSALAQELYISGAGLELTAAMATRVAGVTVGRPLAHRAFAIEAVQANVFSRLSTSTLDLGPNINVVLNGESVNLAGQLASSGAGRDFMAQLATHDAGLALALELARRDAGRAMALHLASVPALRALSEELADLEALSTLGRTLVALEATAPSRLRGSDVISIFANGDFATELARSSAGRAFAATLSNHGAGVEFVIELAKSDFGRNFASELVSSASGLEFVLEQTSKGTSQHLAGELEGTAAGQALNRTFSASGRELAFELQVSALIAACSAVWVLVLVALAVGTTALVVATADLIEEQIPQSRLRVWQDVGASASPRELAEVLFAIDVVGQAIGRWGQLERQLDVDSNEEGQLMTRVQIDSSERPFIVESANYQNPLEVILAAVVAVGGLGGIAATITALTNRERRAIREDRARSEIEKTEAETRDTNAEAEWKELRTQLTRELIEQQRDQYRASPDEVAEILGEDNVLDQLEVLTRNAVQFEELPEARD